MTQNRRVENLEKILLKPTLDPILNLEFTNWFKSHPGYEPIAQPEINNGEVMPEHLKAICFQLKGHKVCIRGNHDANATRMYRIGFHLVLESALLSLGIYKNLVKKFSSFLVSCWIPDCLAKRK